jgi:hypothetical protein
MNLFTQLNEMCATVNNDIYMIKTNMCSSIYIFHCKGSLYNIYVARLR